MTDALAWRAKLWPRPKVDAGLLEPGWTSLDELIADDEAVEDWLAYEGSFTPSLDRRGRAAYLITDYANLLCAAVVPVFVARDLLPDIRPEAVAISYVGKPTVHEGQTLTDRQYSVRFLLDGHQPVAASETVDEWREAFRLAVEGHLEAIIAQLNRLTRLSRSALWRLAGDSIASAFLDVGQRLDRQAEALDHANAILKKPGSPLNNKQLGFFDIAVPLPGQPDREFRRTFRARGGCCRFYLADGGSYCSTCVLKDSEKRDSDIAAAMMSYLKNPKAFGHDH